jgi:hypothetical protein
LKGDLCRLAFIQPAKAACSSNTQECAARNIVERTGVTAERFKASATSLTVIEGSPWAAPRPICERALLASGDFYGPEGLTDSPSKLAPEQLLRDPKNIAICWEGCEAAVGKFEI